MLSRRQFLSSLSVSTLIGLSGCDTPPGPPNSKTTTSQNNSNLSGDLTGIKPDEPPTNIPSNKHCMSDSVSKHTILTDLGNVQYGDYEDWKLRISDTTIPIGTVFTIELQNTGEETLYSASKWAYNLQMYTENGWQEIRWKTRYFEYNEKLIEHEPDTGFKWRFYNTNDGLLAKHPYNNALIICPNIQPGRYRFVFSNPPVAVQFNVVK